MPVVVAFISQKGGVGKSTLARALAAVSAHGGLKVLLADLDPRQETVLQWHRARAKDRAVPRIQAGAFESLDAALEAGARSDLIVLDTPAGVDHSTLSLARRVDLLVQPTGPAVDDLRPTVLVFHELARAAIPKTKMVAALCRVLLKEEEVAARSYIEEAGYSVLAGSIPESASYRIAHNRGQAVTESDERALNERADALMESLLETIGAQHEAATAARQKKKGDVA